jgi:hypothetical protein
MSAQPNASTLSAEIRTSQGLAGRRLAGDARIARASYVDPAAAGGATLKTATATTVAPQTLLAADLIPAGLTAIRTHPRRIRFTTAGATPANAPAEAVITGKDVKGDVLTETVSIAQTATTADSTKFFADITSIAYGAADGAAATVAVGFTDALGFPFEPEVVGGGVAMLRELTDGAVPGTASTLITPASGAPFGGFTPNSVPNASRDYHVWIERV